MPLRCVRKSRLIMQPSVILWALLWISWAFQFTASQQFIEKITEVNGCFSACKNNFKKLKDESLAPLAMANFLKTNQGNFTAAADYACSQVDSIYSCFTTCAGKAQSYGIMYAASDEHLAVQSLKRLQCYTDSMRCRVMDSYFCEALHDFRLCGNDLKRYSDCIVDVQQSRGCKLSQSPSCFYSQRAVQSQIFSSLSYCATAAAYNLVSVHSQDPAYAALQYCEIAIKVQCLGKFSASTDFQPYLSNSVTCGDFTSAATCINSTTSMSYMLSSDTNVSAPCLLLPNSNSALGSLIDQLNNMAPSTCRSGGVCESLASASTTASVSNTTLQARIGYASTPTTDRISDVNSREPNRESTTFASASTTANVSVTTLQARIGYASTPTTDRISEVNTREPNRASTISIRATGHKYEPSTHSCAGLGYFFVNRWTAIVQLISVCLLNIFIVGK